MTHRAITSTIMFIALLLLQTLVCNHITIFGVAVPFIFIYFIICQPVNISTNLLLTLSFLLGVGVDIFSDTAGMNALAAVITAVCKKKVLFAFIQKDDYTSAIIPGISSMGLGAYCRYVFSITAIFCLILFSIEYLSFADIKEILIKSASSTILTTILLLAIDSLSATKHEKRL